MSSEFGSQLTNLGLPPAVDARALASAALKRNRRRIRSLAALTIGLWAITFLLVPSLWMPFAAKMKQQAIILTGMTNGQPAPVTLDTVARVVRDALLHIAAVSGIILGMITIASLLAAISTVWLILTARRLTLEQMSTGLAQISEQLRQLQTKPGS
jgi:hypothetical protein